MLSLIKEGIQKFLINITQRQWLFFNNLDVPYYVSKKTICLQVAVTDWISFKATVSKEVASIIKKSIAREGVESEI